MLRKYPQLKFGLVLLIGVLIALVLCVQCVRTYLYTDRVLVPQQGEYEATRQLGELSAAARRAGIINPHRLVPVMEHTFDTVSDRVLWMRVLDLNSNVIAQVGRPVGSPKLPSHWWDRVEKHEKLGTLIETPQGKALLVMLPLRIGRPPLPSKVEIDQRASEHPAADTSQRPQVNPQVHSGSPDQRATVYVLEVAISLKAVAASFAGLQQNLILGLIASFALLMSVVVIGVRAPHYIRGKYLETELQLAKRVQRDLQPKPSPVSPHLEFAASGVAADHVGGDFYDIFEAESGKVAIVLGDVSGKGVPAALLVSVLHGAIRSSTGPQHEFACERMNRMLCERTACERFATLFWGVFDPATKGLRYVNAGHAAPMLVRRDGGRIERLREGGTVLGLFPEALYSAATVNIEDGDRLIVYSDGVSEAINGDDEEFGEARIAEIISERCDELPDTLCDRIVKQMSAFSCCEAPRDDRTLMVVRFSPAKEAARDRKAGEIPIAAVA